MTRRFVTTLLVAAFVTVAAGSSGADGTGGAFDGYPGGSAAQTEPSSRPAAATFRYVVSATGNTARYRVREQLVGRNLPNDAVGETSDISGAITVDSTGAPIAAQSRIVIGTGGFRSDSDRRDNYVRNRLFNTSEFPEVEFVPTAARGLTALPAPGTASGPISFQVVGNLTVKGVTRVATWQVTARQGADGRLTGQARTLFTFEYIDLTKPRVPIVLSVADTIRLEYDFAFERQP
jgi:polyisoprenoid-binding protein YceI